MDAGMDLSELTALTAETCGCSRRQARDVVAAVHKEGWMLVTALRRLPSGTCFSAGWTLRAHRPHG